MVASEVNSERARTKEIDHSQLAQRGGCGRSLDGGGPKVMNGQDKV